jgi:hypothetical protein
LRVRARWLVPGIAPAVSTPLQRLMRSVRISGSGFEASEAFLRWLEGGDDESWRAECE